MSRSFFSNCVGEYYIDQNAPGNVISNSSNILQGGYRLLKFYNLDEAKKRTLYGAEVTLDIGKITSLSGEDIDSAEIAIELYSLSGSLSAVTYNNFVNNATKYKWYGTTTELKKTIASGSYQTIKLDEGIAGISQAIESGGYVVLCIKASSAQIAFNDSGSMDVYTYSLAPVLSKLNPDGNTFYKNKQQIFSWEYDGDGSEQKSYEIGWSSDDGKTWNSQTLVSSEKEHTFAEETFPEGIIRWRIKVTAEEGLNSGYSESEFYSIAQRPEVSIEFPNAINISNEKEQIFTWNYSGEDLVQQSYEIGWSSDSGVSWDSIVMMSSEQYHTFAANSFPTGQMIWRIRVTNSAGYYSEYVYGEFESVGQSETPIIESVSQDAIPTITWTASNQEAFEIQIVGENVEYESGMIPGADIRSFQPNIMLADGRYEIRIRVLNLYGKISDWGGTVITLNTKKPVSSPIFILKENGLYGATLSGSGISGRGFFVRKEKRYQSTIFETTYMTTDTAWETRNISVGDFIPELGDITAAGYFVYKQKIKKGEVLELCPGWYISASSYLFSDRLIVTDNNYIVVETVLFDDLDDVREHTFKKDGYFYLCATYPNSSGVSLFEIKRELNTDLPASFCDNEVIIAEYAEGKTVIDCDIFPGRKYIYVLRDYSTGYVETKEKIFACDFEGIVFHDVDNPENMVHIQLSESEYLKEESVLSKNTVYKQCVGREFPIKETNEQKNERISVTGFLNVEQYKKAYEMFYSNKIVLLRSKDYCCHADISSFKKQKYFDRGYIVEIVFERLDKSEGVKLV